MGEKNKKKLKRSRSSSKRRKLKDSDSESSSSEDSDDSMSSEEDSDSSTSESWNSCLGDGNGAEGQYDDNSAFTSLKPQIDSIWNGLTGLNSAAASDKFSCLDFCVNVQGTEDQLSSAIPNLSSSSYSKFDDDMESLAAQAFVDGVSAASAARATVADIEVTTIRGELEFTNAPGSGDGETTTVPVVTTTAAPGGTTDVATTSSSTSLTTTVPMLAFSGCITLYFPILWVVQTLFPGLFDFCPIFADNFCRDFAAVGGKCWSNHCDAVCRGDGQSDVEKPDDNDPASTDANSNKGECFKENGQLSENAQANVAKFGCFDFCFEVHLTNDQFTALESQACRSGKCSRQFSFNEADLIALAENIADDAV